MHKTTSLILLVSLITNLAMAQIDANGGDFYAINQSESHQCISNNERQKIFQQIELNRKYLKTEDNLSSDSRAITSFIWPIKNTNGNDEFASYGISNYVDHNSNSPNQLSDYQCQNKTYDTNNGYNHQGLDIFLWPFEWYKMENNHVSVIAAASGVIVYKQDGSFDKNCSFNNDTWNAV